MSYVELHACSAFSFLRGGSFPEHLAERAAKLEMPAMALLDRNGVYGAQRFSAAARENNVRPIIGSELTLEDGSILPVLVENCTGYKNLCELLTQAHLRSEKGSCLIRLDELEKFSDGLVALFSHLGSACVSRAGFGVSPKQSSLKSSRRRDVVASTRDACATQSCVQRLIDAFGRDDVYVEIQRHFVRGEEQTNQRLIDLADHYQLPLLATNGVQYATANGREVLDVFTCIREHTHLDAAGKLLSAKQRAPSQERC